MKRFFVVVILLSAAALPALTAAPTESVAPVEPAAADSDRSCDIDNYRNATDNYGKSASIVGKVFGGYEDPKWDCEDLQDDLSYYQAASSMKSGYQAFVTTYDNSLQDSALGAYSEMEKAVLWSYDNGTSLANAKIDAKQAYGRYYSVKETNYLENWHVISHAMKTWENQSQYKMFEPGYSWDFDRSTTYYDQGGGAQQLGEYYSWDALHISFAGLGSRTIETVNGTNETVPTLKYDVTLELLYDSAASTWSDTDTRTVEIGPNDGRFEPAANNSTSWSYTDNAGDTVEVFGSGIGISIGSIQVQPPPDSDLSTQHWLQFQPARDRLETLESEYDNFDNSSAAYTEGIYNGLETGRISYSDAISRATQVDTYLQQSADENATFSIAQVGLAGAGLDSVNVANTSYMELQFDAARYGNETNPITRDGMLLSRGAPDAGWQFNTSYDAANISGGQMVLDLDGEEYTINGSFQIIRAYDNSGDPMDASEIQNPDADRLEAYNATAYVEMLNDTREQITALEEKLEDDSGVGSLPDVSGFVDGLTNFVATGLMGLLKLLAIAIAAIVGIALALNMLMSAVTQ